ncbi:MAG: hypothetical protein K0R90_761, partial [Oscillospiraceae bacterium]|nr:hypothetical protein [Oscillospiraceae bacterium]
GHGCGRAVSDGWTASPAEDGAAHMIYAPYETNVPIGNRCVTFRMKVDNNALDNLKVATIDVNNAATGTILATMDINRQQFMESNQYQDLKLLFNQTTINPRLEYRVYFHDAATITVDNITLN